MKTSAQKLLEFTSGMSIAEFLQDQKTQSACIREIGVIGEAAAQVRTRFRLFSDDHPEIPWLFYSKLRNNYVHEYRTINLERLWETIQDRIPQLASDISVLANLEPNISENGI